MLSLTDSKSAKHYYFVAAIIIVFASGIARYDQKDLSDQVPSIEEITDEGYLEALVCSEVEQKDKFNRHVLCLASSKVKVLMTTSPHESYSYGSQIRVSGNIKRPRGSPDFAWDEYLAKDEIYYEIYFPKSVEVTADRQGNSVKQVLFDLKQKYLGNLRRLVPEPAAAFAGGLTVGAKESMGDDLLDDFRKVGLIHLVVLSGYNMAVIAEVLRVVLDRLSFVSQRLTLTVSVSAIALFAVLVGAGPTVVRAAIMAIILVFARYLGQPYVATRALLIAGLIMVIHNPKVLVFDVGFQLSFLATLGLIYLAPMFDQFLKIKRQRGLKRVVLESLSITASAQLAVLPWILYKFGTFSLVALPANLIVLPLVPIVMLLAFIASTIGFISLSLATPVAWLAYGLLELKLVVVRLLARVPYAEIEPGQIPLFAAIWLYLYMGMFIYRRRDMMTKPKRL